MISRDTDHSQRSCGGGGHRGAMWTGGQRSTEAVHKKNVRKFHLIETSQQVAARAPVDLFVAWNNFKNQNIFGIVLGTGRSKLRCPFFTTLVGCSGRLGCLLGLSNNSSKA